MKRHVGAQLVVVTVIYLAYLVTAAWRYKLIGATCAFLVFSVPVGMISFAVDPGYSSHTESRVGKGTKYALLVGVMGWALLLAPAVLWSISVIRK